MRTETLGVWQPWLRFAWGRSCSAELLQDYLEPTSRMCAQRLLIERPSLPERFSRRWWVCQFMVSVTLTGLRLASSEADGKAGISRRPATEDGGAINSRRLRLALVREMTLQWETNDCGMNCTLTSALLRICCSRGLVEQVVHPNGHGAQDFWVRTLAGPNRWCDAIGRHQRHPGWPAEFFLSADEDDCVLATPLLLKFLPGCLQGTGLAFGPFNGVGGLADCLQQRPGYVGEL